MQVECAVSNMQDRCSNRSNNSGSRSRSSYRKQEGHITLNLSPVHGAITQKCLYMYNVYNTAKLQHTYTYIYTKGMNGGGGGSRAFSSTCAHVMTH